MNKSIPVIAEPAAAKVCQAMGFKKVFSMAHGDKVVVGDGKLEVVATAGALVGPPWATRQNGFVFRDTGSDLKV